MKTALLNFAKSFAANIRTIIFALVLSVIIWLAISFQIFPNVPREIAVPLSVEPTEYMRDVNLEVFGAFEREFKVMIEGKRHEISGLGADDFFAYLDFSKIREAGEYDVPVVVETESNANFSILNGSGEEVRVNIIRTAQRAIATTANIAAGGITAAEGMSIDEARITISPVLVTVRGEKSLVDSVARAEVSVWSSEPLTGTVTLQGQLTFYDSAGEPIDGKGLELSEERAFMVTIPVYRHRTLPIDVTFTDVPANFDLESLREKARLEPAELSIASPDMTIDNLDISQLGAISLRDIHSRDLDRGLIIDVVMPDGYVNVSGHNTVRLVFDGAEDYGVIPFEIPASNFSAINLPPGYRVRYITQQVPVRVVGPAHVIQSLTVDDISGTINFAGMGEFSPGMRQVGIRFTLRGTNVQAWVFDEYRIDIEITET